MRVWALPWALAGALLASPARAAEDPLAALATLVRAGDHAAALTALAALPAELARQAEVRYLRARLLEGQGQPAAALGALPAPDGLPPAVADDVAVRRARLQARLGQCPAARVAAQALAERDVAVTEMLAVVAECAGAAGDHAAEVAALRAALGAGPPRARAGALRLELAAAELAAGARERGLAELRQLALEHPDLPEAGQARARLAELGAPLQLELEARMALAERWIELRQPARALEVLDAGDAPAGGKLRAGWLHVRGMALYRHRRRYTEAAIALGKAARLKGELEAFDRFHAARAWARADRDRRAVRALRAFAKRHPNSRFVPRAHYTAAWLELRHGMGGGARNMQRFLDSEHAGDAPGLARQGLFQLAMHNYDRRRFGRAREIFERYARHGRGAMIRARGLYWAARAATAGKEPERARTLLHDARAVEPLHWYALLAARRLQELGETPAPPFAAAPAAARPAGLSPTLPKAVAFYARLGLMDDARALLVRQRQQVRARAPAGRAGEALVAAHQLLGDHAAARRLVAREHGELLKAAPTPATAWAWRAAYARPHAAAVERHARQQQVEAALIFAVMRKESGFDPSVVSSADAIGLMQLIPKTARKVAGGLGLPYSRQRLREPAYNLQLGARLLGQLLARFEGQAPLALAAYNAGAHQVEPWLHREAGKGGRVDLDRFVERIPIDQTRNYVRRTITNWARYRYLADGAEPWSELPVALALPSSARRRR